ncbi:NDR1/HIN1-like protein 2 [Lathyrus oleraceus]|uniref:NDR1/HIN1-like protein 2 n=1 Tax=Pisum sativum TaxID=3888 RepID=UPI0021CF5F2C|nr:NDR1/HIN1-like protein 2 [Pisum sativum]
MAINCSNVIYHFILNLLCGPYFEQIKLTFLTIFALSTSSWIIFCAVITFAPSNVKFHVTQASLTKFNLTTNTLDYKLEANITSRNPNKNVEIHYMRVTAIAWYKDNEFARVNLSSFDQGPKNTTFLHVGFEGKGVIILKPKQLFEYSQETRVGIYNDLAIDLDFSMTYKFGIHKSWPFEPPIVKCRRLSLSLISNGNSSAAAPSFQVRRCRTGPFFVNR